MRGHIRKRGNKWNVVLDVGRDENGRRKQRWLSGFDTRRAAHQALTDALSRLQAGNYVEPTRETVATFLRGWIEAQRATVRPSTWRSYAMIVESHIIPHLGSTPLQRLTAASLNAFYADLLTSGGVARKGKPLSPRTTRYIHTVLRKALADAVRWSRLARNVADQADPPSTRVTSSREMKTWTAAELRGFLDHVQADRLHAAWTLAATTGMRRGEVLGLRWTDLDLDRARLSVRQTLIAVRYELSFSTPKTKKSTRNVALDSTTVATLKTHRVAQLEERLAFGLGSPTGDGLVFTQPNGEPVHPDRFSGWFQQHIRAAGLPRIRLHDLRHTHATLALSAGIHAKVVSERLGHSTVSITLDTYSHAIPAMQEDAADKVAALVFSS